MLPAQPPLGTIGSSGTQIQWPRQRMSEKSCGVMDSDILYALCFCVIFVVNQAKAKQSPPRYQNMCQ